MEKWNLSCRNYFFFQAEDGIRYYKVTGVQTCALPICRHDVVVGAAAERERGERDREAQGAQFGGDVVARGAVALGRGTRMTHAFERRDVTAQAARERRALTRS